MIPEEKKMTRQIISKGETRNYFTAEVVYKGNGFSRTKHERYDKITGNIIHRNPQQKP